MGAGGRKMESQIDMDKQKQKEKYTKILARFPLNAKIRNNVQIFL